MKRLSFLFIAIAMVLSMSQCKKKTEVITPDNPNDGVQITLIVNQGQKHEVLVGSGVVNYQEGDVVYVANGGKYKGTLTYHENSSSFTGTISSDLSTDDYLHFYFVGGLTPSVTLVADATEDFTVDISNQVDNLPVLSYEHSQDKYDGETTTYELMLKNRCGLVKFKLSRTTRESAILCGMHNEAKIDFANNCITPTNSVGAISLYNYSSDAKWAILLPQTQVVNPAIGIYGFISSIQVVPPVMENLHFVTGVPVSMTPVSYEFTVENTNDTPRKVAFSPGNLQAKKRASNYSWEWYFAPTQLDYVGDAPANNAINGWGTVSEYGGRVDLFGWSANNAQLTPQGFNNYGIGYVSYGEAFQTTANPILYYGEFRDWGTNSISNHPANTWRTLTSDEWDYLLNHSTMGASTVNGVMGYIIRPDGNTTAVESTYTAEEWVAQQDAGSVFLPAAGYRNGSTITGPGGSFIYRSSTRIVHSVNDEEYQGAMGVCCYGVPGSYPLAIVDVNLWFGYSVRLVRDIVE